MLSFCMEGDSLYTSRNLYTWMMVQSVVSSLDDNNTDKRQILLNIHHPHHRYRGLLLEIHQMILNTKNQTTPSLFKSPITYLPISNQAPINEVC